VDFSVQSKLICWR